MNKKKKHLNKGQTEARPSEKKHINRMVWMAVLRERASLDVANDSIDKVMLFGGQLGYGLLSLPYMRTDAARNQYAKKFLEATQADNRTPNELDTVIMFDNDHKFDPQIAGWLAGCLTGRKGDSEGVVRGVVGALAFKRGEPFEPCFFKRGPDGHLHSIAEWEPGLYEGEVVGCAAIAIARWVFEDLMDKGHPYPWWRYTYTDDSWELPSEDMYFAKLCEASGIHHWCDTRQEAPHLILAQVDSGVWKEYLGDHPDLLANDEQPDGMEVPILMQYQKEGGDDQSVS